MSYDVPFRFLQALDPSALTSLPAAIHAVDAAITDSRNAGKDFETDPAVLLLIRHAGRLATDERQTDLQLRRACIDQIAELKRRPALLVLSQKGVAYDASAKHLFHADGRRAMRRLADALGLREDAYDIRSNAGGVAVSGEITLHGEEVWVQLSLDCRGADLEILYRRVSGRRDHVGERNHWTSVRDLLAPDRFAQRLRRELALTPAPEQAVRLFA